jgi:hypothetical protein
MKKVLPILTVIILVLSGLGAAAITNITTNNVIINRDNIEKFGTFEKAEISKSAFTSYGIERYSSEYINVKMEGISTYRSVPGNPVVPKVVKVFELPFDAKNIDVEVTVNNVKEQVIDKEIRPGPPHLPLIASDEEVPVVYEKNVQIYSSEQLYPTKWYDVDITVGANENRDIITNVAVKLYPIRYSPKLDTISIADRTDIKITYDLGETRPISDEDDYDLMIIAPSKFSLALIRLISHKSNNGIKTELHTTESIYKNYAEEDGDKPFKIKKAIQHEIEYHNISYVLLVGGLKNHIWAEPNEHHNYGVKGWHVPVRYHNFFDNPEHPLSFADIYDPGVISDLYYADIYRYNETTEEIEFNDWNSNGDDYIGAWGMRKRGFDVDNDTNLDLNPDVSVGRLACRNTKEVRDVVSKIINYERYTTGKNWFNRITVISGDGFMDQADLDFQWNTTEEPDGKYSICAQSRVGEGAYGVLDKVNITINRSSNTYLNVHHDDHLRIEGYPNSYPTVPIAEIINVDDGNNLGWDNFVNNSVSEGDAYGNSFTGWANINFTDGILHIRGKTYNPEPYGNVTNIRCWVENEGGEVIFDDVRENVEMYYEGEWVCGDQSLLGGGGALYYMPEDFEQEVIFASNGELTGPDDIIDALGDGCGFAFISGHGSPCVWSDHFPGIPGDRFNGSIPGIFSITYVPKFLPIIPSFPLNKIRNYDKLPIMLIGGCHNSQFNVSMIPTLLDKHNEKMTWSHGIPTPECFSWSFVRMPRQGAIATIGNTGLGYGVPGKPCLVEGLDGGICIQFFKNYSKLYEIDKDNIYLGDVYLNTQRAYVNQFDMEFLDHAKSLTQWVLLGDPSLKIGGY